MLATRESSRPTGHLYLRVARGPSSAFLCRVSKPAITGGGDYHRVLARRGFAPEVQMSWPKLGRRVTLSRRLQLGKDDPASIFLPTAKLQALALLRFCCFLPSFSDSIHFFHQQVALYMLLCVEIGVNPDLILHLRFRRVHPLLLCILVDLSAAAFAGVGSDGRERDCGRAGGSPSRLLRGSWISM
jgi:hypothetical protein